MKYKRQLAAISEFFLIVTGTVIAIIYDVADYRPSPIFLELVSLMCTAALVLLSLILITEIISSIKFESSSVFCPLLAGSLFFHFFCSTDVSNMFASLGFIFHPRTAEIFSYIFFMCIVIFSLCLIDTQNSVHTFRRTAVITGAICIGSLTAFIHLQQYSLQYIPCFVFIAYTIVVFTIQGIAVMRKDADGFVFYIASLILCSTFGSQLVYTLDKCELVSVTTYGYALIYAFIKILLFVSTYFYFILKTTLQTSEYKLQVNTLKSEILREQIKPHFIFNSLTTIKALYHKNLDEGDHAIDMFSRHLRSNVEAANTDLIPFERELDNIQNYIELENTKYDKKFNVIYNIDVTEFSVPILSLQPFVENAIKYSKVNLSDEGYIEISSYEKNGEILLEICDNGVGFDENEIGDKSFGIKNSRERFKLLMNATIDIMSKKGEGTRIVIHIAKSAKDNAAK